MEKKSWLKKDFSELRAERKVKPKEKKERPIKVEVKREPSIPKVKPKLKKERYLVKVWVKGDNDPWKITNMTKEEIDEFGDAVVNETEGFVRIGKMGLINLKETVLITINKVKEE